MNSEKLSKIAGYIFFLIITYNLKLSLLKVKMER